MPYWRFEAKKTHRVRAFILKGSRHVSNVWVSSPSQDQKEKGAEEKEEAVKPALTA